MAFISSISPSSTSSRTSTSFSPFNYPLSSSQPQSSRRLQFYIPTRRLLLPPVTAAHVCTGETQNRIDRSLLKVSEAFSEDELWAAACLRVRSFNHFDSTTFRVQDHKKYLAEREFEALKERVAGKREGFRRVSCINATLPLPQVSNISDELCDSCKFSECGEDRVVVGTLDLNNCLHLPDEITGKKPEGSGAVVGRAYLSNVCVAEELLRNGLAYSLIAKSKIVAQGWGISDLYVHVAIDNIPAKNLYMKSGFIHESDEPAWQARHLNRIRRLLLWTGLANHESL